MIIPSSQRVVVKHGDRGALGGGAGGSGGGTSCRTRARLAAALGVVVVPVGRLLQLHDVDREADELGRNNGADDEDEEQHKHAEVHDGVANDAALAQLRLLERVDGRADLTARYLSAWLDERGK